MKLALGEIGIVLSTISLSLSLFKIFPSISLNSAFKKFTVIEYLISFGFIAAYGVDLHRLRMMVPDEEFEGRASGNYKTNFPSNQQK